MLSMAGRMTKHYWPQVKAIRQNSNRTCMGSGWRNDTPKGSTTEVFTYNPELNISWPETKLGVFAKKDKNFSLPGDICPNPTGKLDLLCDPPPSSKLDITSVKESQVHALYNANDFIRYTPGSGPEVFVDPDAWEGTEFPPLPSLDNMDLEAQTCPTLLRREFDLMFPERDLAQGPLSVITMTIMTEHDMSTWSEEVDAEREKLTEHTVINCKELCGRLRDDGYWADFIDPCSGTPHFAPHTNTTLFETNERMKLLGFNIDDLGCCKVISHKRFNRYCFVGVIVTDAAAGSDSVENIVQDISPYFY